MRFAEMFFDFLAALESRRVWNIQTNEFRFEAVILDPFFDDGLVFHDFHAGLEFFELHSRKAFCVKFAQLSLVIVIIGRTENCPAHSALPHESISSFWRISRRAL